MKGNYRPEVDISDELGDELATQYQQIIGILRWSIELGHIVIITQVLRDILKLLIGYLNIYILTKQVVVSCLMTICQKLRKNGSSKLIESQSMEM